MKRYKLRILLCLLFGAVTTVTVAWGCGVWSYRKPLLVDFEHSTKEIQSLFTNIGWQKTPAGETETYLPEYGSARGFGVLDESLSELGVTGDGPGDFNITGFSGNSALRQRSGWPLLALEGRVWGMQDTESEYSHRWAAIQIPMTVSDTRSFDSEYIDFTYDVVRLIPLFPIWFGFLINTLFYGIIWYCAMLFFTSLKRKLRTIKGRCPKCAYDLRADFNSGCPECGWNRGNAE